MNEGKPKPIAGLDSGTQLARERSGLAMGRNHLPGKRTLVAWIRKSLSMIAFGFTVLALNTIGLGQQFSVTFIEAPLLAAVGGFALTLPAAQL